ncbi:MAG TPA: hypothetical protein VGM59_05305 [Dongiaceae bacterium]
MAASIAGDVADRACQALRARIDAIGGAGPLFLRSYDGPDGLRPDPEPALGGAFTYDNALAAIALHACGDDARARRIADALLEAAENDRSGVRGRLRNAYRPGLVKEHPIPPMGWWSDQDQHWAEDPYEVSSATGNMAWAALALLTLAEATHDQRYVLGAAEIAKWSIDAAYAMQPLQGFTGGIYGYDDKPVPLTWKSTEHNIDMTAVLDWLARADSKKSWQSYARAARAFVAAQWDPSGGHFWIGTTLDGKTPNRKNQGLDAELWPLLLENPPETWKASLAFVERSFAVKGGFDFNDDRDGIWLEGTAQAALVYRLLGRNNDADRLFSTIAAQFSPGGMVWATDVRRLTTGLALSPTSTRDDFYYYRLPHLGATAWAALAATGWDPFTGRKVARSE